MTIYFSSDQHFWHANVIRYCNRPFKYVEEMNEAMIYNWNSVVKPEDTVYDLGDFSFAGRSVELYSARLVGKKRLISGNHDPIHPHNKHQKKKVKQGEPDYWKKFYESHGWEVGDLIEEITFEGVKFILSHMPYDTVDARYVNFLPKNNGEWLLCGHIHEKWLMKDKMINVGVDAWNGKPVSIEEILKLTQQYPEGAHLQPDQWKNK